MQAQMYEPQSSNTQPRPSKQARFPGKYMVALAFILVVVALIIILAWHFWVPIQHTWNSTTWLRWLVFVVVVLFATVSSLLWIFKSAPTKRRYRVAVTVISLLAICTFIWILGTLKILPEETSTIMVALFTAAGIAFAFLQWILPFTPLSSTPADSAHISSQPSLASLAPSRPVHPVQPPHVSIPGPSAADAPLVEGHVQDGRTDFFISYDERDRAYAEWIDRQLRDEHYSTFLLIYDMQPGANFPNELNKATTRANHTLLILSPNYPLATHPEWTVALMKDMTSEQRRLIPVYIESCPELLQGLLAPIVPIDLIGLDGPEAHKALLDGIRPRGLRPSGPPSYPGPRQPEKDTH